MNKDFQYSINTIYCKLVKLEMPLGTASNGDDQKGMPVAEEKRCT
jgi:hypothetical protein